METDKETTERGLSSIVHALLSFIPSGLREIAGLISGIVLMVAVPVALILGVMLLYHANERAKVAEVPCWQLQVIKDRVFKLNSCTGDVSEVREVPPPSARKKGK